VLTGDFISIGARLDADPQNQRPVVPAVPWSRHTTPRSVRKLVKGGEQQHFRYLDGNQGHQWREVNA
jgi:hypothetical protein